jgi:hypothetical protein
LVYWPDKFEKNVLDKNNFDEDELEINNIEKYKNKNIIYVFVFKII